MRGAIELWEQHLRMDLHLSLLNANSALRQLQSQEAELTPEEVVLLHYTELYLGAAE
ncbi:MAG: hypothetical protein QME78_00310 [Thermodesulfobacteriota bacterium]|nr:hypothetical protein [Thermodesulfobacteriota bacterium]